MTLFDCIICDFSPHPKCGVLVFFGQVQQGEPPTDNTHNRQHTQQTAQITDITHNRRHTPQTAHTTDNTHNREYTRQHTQQTTLSEHSQSTLRAHTTLAFPEGYHSSLGIFPFWSPKSAVTSADSEMILDIVLGILDPFRTPSSPPPPRTPLRALSEHS